MDGKVLKEMMKVPLALLRALIEVCHCMCKEDLENCMVASAEASAKENRGHVRLQHTVYTEKQTNTGHLFVL